MPKRAYYDLCGAITDEDIADRERLRVEILEAFRATGAVTHYRWMMDVTFNHSAFRLSAGYLGHRRVTVELRHPDECRVLVSRPFDAPDGPSAARMHDGSEADTLIAAIAASTPGLGAEIVRLVRAATSGIEAKPIAARRGRKRVTSPGVT